MDEIIHARRMLEAFKTAAGLNIPKDVNVSV
jgi:hypothetical protein